MNTAGVV